MIVSDFCIILKYFKLFKIYALLIKKYKKGIEKVFEDF
jgi:hypothetical protein